MVKEEIKVDPVTAILLQQNDKALKAYDKYFQMGGDLQKYIDAAKVNLRDTYINVIPKDYEKYKQDTAYEIGLALEELNKVATLIKTAECRLSYEYWDCWRFCAVGDANHPERSVREKFCKDYRANEPPEKCVHYYCVGDSIIGYHLLKGYSYGKVVRIEGDKMTIRMVPDKGQKKKEVTVKTDDLRAFPLNLQWRHKKPCKNQSLEEQ